MGGAAIFRDTVGDFEKIDIFPCRSSLEEKIFQKIITRSRSPSSIDSIKTENLQIVRV